MLLAPAYALGALDPDDRRAFEEHLSTCAACTAEVRSMSRVTGALGQTVTLVSPRPELRNRVLSAVGASGAGRQQAVVVPHKRDVPAPPVWLAYAAVLALAAALGVFAMTQRSRMQDLEARLAEAFSTIRLSQEELKNAQASFGEAQAKVEVFTAPDLVRIDLKGDAAIAPQAVGRAMWSRRRGMVFSATNLPPAPEGRVYQVWVLTSSTNPISAGLLNTDGSGMFMTPADIPPPTAVAVSIEPAGGVPQPTGSIYLVGKPAAL
jgi:anti-sigma-K factor RskA